MKRVRRLYENTALVAVRKTRQLALFWTRRGRKSTTLGNISFDEMSGTPGRTVIAASASLLLGKELVGMTLSAAETAAIVTREAMAVNDAFVQGASDKSLNLKIADTSTNKEYQSPEVPDTQHATRNKPTASSLTLSNPMVYAAIHQFGGQIKGNPWLRFQINGKWVTASQVTIPARPFFPVESGHLTAKAEEKIRASGVSGRKRLILEAARNAEGSSEAANG